MSGSSADSTDCPLSSAMTPAGRRQRVGHAASCRARRCRPRQPGSRARPHPSGRREPGLGRHPGLPAPHARLGLDREARRRPGAPGGRRMGARRRDGRSGRGGRASVASMLL
jgi:hypothetical protein